MQGLFSSLPNACLMKQSHCRYALHGLQGIAKNLQQHTALQVNQTVWSWVRGAGQNAVPPFLKNKIAQNAACLLQVESPLLQHQCTRHPSVYCCGHTKPMRIDLQAIG
jgi:hypothetical protein